MSESSKKSETTANPSIKEYRERYGISEVPHGIRAKEAQARADAERENLKEKRKRYPVRGCRIYQNGKTKLLARFHSDVYLCEFEDALNQAKDEIAERRAKIRKLEQELAEPDEYETDAELDELGSDEENNDEKPHECWENAKEEEDIKVRRVSPDGDLGDGSGDKEQSPLGEETESWVGRDSIPLLDLDDIPPLFDGELQLMNATCTHSNA